jgi:hypothetical protein
MENIAIRWMTFKENIFSYYAISSRITRIEKTGAILCYIIFPEKAKNIFSLEN